MQGIAISMIVSMLMMATLSSPALAQTAATATPAVTATSGVPANAPKPLLRNTFNHMKTGFQLKGAHLSVACETCHVGGTFKGTPKDCAGCHTVGRLVAATPKTQDHIPTTKPCEACHANGASFLTAIMDHTGLTEPCAVCHGGNFSPMVKSVPQDTLHQQNSNLPCDNCHKNTFTFTGTLFDHTNTTSDCLNCHNSSSKNGAQAIASVHIPTAPNQPCESCHTPSVTPGWPHPTSFLGATFDHFATGNTIGTNTCNTCHASMPGVKGKPSSHVTTALQCDICHTSTTSFAAPNWIMSHTGIISGCSSCHGGQLFQGSVPNPPTFKSANHIPSSTVCETCHSTSNTTAGGFATPNPAMNHVGITTGCATCHNGANVGTTVTTIVLGKAAPTINHIPTAAPCETCHTTAPVGVGPIGGFASPNPAMSHTGITTGCATCHSGTNGNGTNVGTTVTTIVLGLPANHITVAAGVGCESCHTSTATPGGFTQWTMNHAANHNTTGCATCHDNGKSFNDVPSLVTLSAAAHVPVTGIACESCHSNSNFATGAFTTAWIMGITGHTAVASTSCATCHDTNTSFTGVRTKTASHITTSAPCGDCHTQTNTNGFTTFLNAQFDHGVIGTARCDSCHGGSIAGIKAKSANHISTSQDCVVCHFPAPTAVAPANGFNLPNPAMDHIGLPATGCATCHTGANVGTTVTTIVLGKPTTHITTTLACETCHSTPPTGKGPIGGFATDWTMNHTGITSGCASCHLQSGDSTVGHATIKGKPSAHVTTSIACESCHSITSTSTGGFAAPNWTMNHAANGNTSNCANCHMQSGDTTVGTTTVKGKPATHIPSTAPCESCHSSSSTSTGGFVAPSWAMGISGHTAVNSMPPSPAVRCDSCHGLGKSFQGVTITNQDSINSHPIPVTQDCGTCHGSVTSFITSTTYNHVGVPTGSCSNCHDGVIALGKPAGHVVTTPVNETCDDCHTNKVYTTGGFLMTVSHSNLGTNAVVGNHLCATACHNGSGTVALKGSPEPGTHGTAGTHIPTNGTVPGVPADPACDACHKNTTSFLGALMDHSGISTSCSTCHGGTYAGVVSKPAYHIASGLACEACHINTLPPSGAIGGFAAPNWSMQTTQHSNNGNTSACETCHLPSGDSTLGTAVVKGKPAYHIATALACVTCHASAHSNTGDFATQWTLDHSANGNTTACETCHLPSGDTTLGSVLVKGKPSTHIPLPVATCVSCHTITTTGGFSTWTMSHTGISTGCASCHNGQTFQVTGAVLAPATMPTVSKPLTHITTTAACELCHTTTTIPNGFRTWTMSHTGISSGCASCHDTGKVFQNTSGTTLVTKPAGVNHIATTAPCETCHSTSIFTSPGGFAAPNWIMGVAGHTGVNSLPPTPGTPCTNCHTGQTFVTGVTPKQKTDAPFTHVTTSADCGSCHGNVTSFKLAVTFSHNPVPTGQCANCHDGVIALGKPPAHLTTSASCDTCHTNGVFTVGGFKMTAFNHLSPAAATWGSHQCGTSCHNDPANQITKGGTEPSTHINVALTTIPAASCDSCHGNTTSFLGATMNHSGISTGCSTCHGGQFAGVVSEPSYHIATTISCESCHPATSTSTGGFAAPHWTMNHTANSNTSNCASCHTGATLGTTVVMGKPANHTPTTAACEACHSTTNTSTGGFANPNPAMNHAGISTGCATCHTGANVGTTVSTIVLGKPANHTPTTAACETCHSTAPTGVGPIGGFAIPNPAMNHTGITTGCATCHTGANVGTTVSTIVLGKPATHIVTTAACEVCHTTPPSGTGPIGGFVAPNWVMGTTGHTAVNSMPPSPATRCDSCHGLGKSFQGVTITNQNSVINPHPVTVSADCGTCHGSVTSFITSTTFTHNPVPTGQCANCHNGTIALGKPAGHVVTSASCDSCHTNGVFTVGGFLMTVSHSTLGTNAVVGNHLCATACHNSSNTVLTGSPEPGTHGTAGTHIPTNGTVAGVPVDPACDSCHGNTTSFLGAVMNHSAISTGCATCHGGTYSGVVSKPSYHTATSLACEVCHNNTLPPSGAIGGFAAPNWTMQHTLNGNTSACENCHLSSGDTTLGTTVVKGKPATHIPLPVSTCVSCHTTTTPNGFQTWTMNHTGITSGCATCHGGQTFQATTVPAPATMPPVAKPGNHVPTTAACELCHSNTTTPNGFQTWTMNHAGAAITSGCASCHASGLSFKNTIGTPLVLLNTSIHIPVGSTPCESCHNPALTTTGGFATPVTGWTMGTAGHSLVSGTPCANCHTQGATTSPYTGVVAQNSIINPHVPATTGACDSCHTATNTSGFTNFLGATGPHTSNPKPSLGTSCNSSNCHGTGGVGKQAIANHIPQGALDCDACHTWSSFVSPPVTTVHTAITGTACSTCHNAGLNYVGFTGGGLVVTKPAGAAHITTALTCNSCHTSTTYAPGSFNLWTMSHSGITSGCASCHGAGLTFTNNGGTALVQLASPPHVPIGSVTCETCHSTTNFATGAFATPTTGWTMGPTGHTAVTATPCATCHVAGVATSSYTGVVAQNNSATHISSAYYPVEDCGVCHTAATTSNFATGGFTAMTGIGLPTHTGITANCAPCHNNVIAKGTASFATHMAIGTSDCVSCHTVGSTASYTTFLGAVAGHSGAAIDATTCATNCHKTGGTGKVFTSQHIPSSSPGATIAAGTTVGQCVGCHTTSYTTMSFTTYDSSKIHTASNWATSLKCSQCHNGSYTGEGTVGAQAKTLVNHIPTAITDVSGLDCNACHYYTGTAPTISATGFAGSKSAVGEYMDHNGATGMGQVNGIYCVTCHLNGVTNLMSGAQQQNHRGASTTTDCSSSGCHKPLGKTGSFGPYTR